MINVLKYINEFLKFLFQKIPVSIHMHILICMSYLIDDRFQTVLEEIQFVKNLNNFVEYY